MRHLYIILCTILGVIPLVGADTPFDPEIRRTLEKAEFKVTEEKNGIFSVIVDLPKLKRSHKVFINSGTYDFHGYEFREVWSIGFQGPSLQEGKTTEYLLRHAADQYVGGWKLQEMGGVPTAIYFTDLDKKEKGRSLLVMIAAVAAIADHAEKEIVKTDDY